jgi:hypothetical protein
VLEEMGRRGGPTKATRRLGLGWQSGPPVCLASAAGDWRAWQRQWTRAFFQGSKQQQKQRPFSSRLARLGSPSQLRPSATGHWLLGVTRARADKAWTPASSWLRVLCTRCTVFLSGTA